MNDVILTVRNEDQSKDNYLHTLHELWAHLHELHALVIDTKTHPSYQLISTQSVYEFNSINDSIEHLNQSITYQTTFT